MRKTTTTGTLTFRTGTSYQQPPPGRVGGGKCTQQPGSKSGNSEAMTVLLLSVRVLGSEVACCWHRGHYGTKVTCTSKPARPLPITCTFTWRTLQACDIQVDGPQMTFVNAQGAAQRLT